MYEALQNFLVIAGKETTRGWRKSLWDDGI